MVYAYDGLHLKGKDTFTNTVVASGGSSNVTYIPVGADMTDRSSLTGTVIVNPSATTLRGYGLLDTCIIRIKSSMLGGDVVIFLDSTVGLPDTTYIAITGIDTLFKSDFYLECVVADSSADSTFTADHDVFWDIVVR